MTATYGLMRVGRVIDFTGSHIEPALDLGWPPGEQLRWKAGVVYADTGLRVEVAEGVSLVDGEPVRGTFGWRCAGMSGAAYDFNGLWEFLSGMDTGAELMKRKIDDRRFP